MTITFARGDARDAAEQDAAPAERLLEHERARLGRDLAGDLRHRRQQRQPALLVLDRLVGDADRAGLGERSGQLRGRREVQVRKEGLTRFKEGDLGHLRLFHLEDHVRGAEDVLGGGHHPRALGIEVSVGDRAALSGPLLDQDLVATLGELPDADRGHRDPVLVRLDLGRNSNDHRTSSLALKASQSSIRSVARLRSRPVSSSIFRIR